MSTLRIDLQDGFAGQPVAIRLNGREVYRKAQVRTDLRISRADAVEIEAPAGSTVEVEAQGQTTSVSVDAARTPFLAVNLDPQGCPEIRTSTEPFAYL